MSRLASFALCLTVAAIGTLEAGCVQYPTEAHGVVDQRPTLSFRMPAVDPIRVEARVTIDGLDSGRAGDFIEGAASLRVLPGNHVVRVTAQNGGVLLDERIYVGDGVHRTLQLP
jgi:hypothetical protein